MISDKVYKLCHETKTVSSEMAEDPSAAPGDIYKKLYGHYEGSEFSAKERKHKEITETDLKKAEDCGQWGPTKPSELFLQIFHDTLCTLNKNVEGAVVSPPLMGSCGVMPLTIMSTVPDIMRHMSNLIVRAQKEVFIATNYWMSSVASKFVTNALLELSKRAGERKSRVVVKIMYDRGSLWQLVENHQNVPEKEYIAKSVNLPPSKDIPNIDIQVVNYHKPPLGTFHAKFMIVDRKFGIIQSNNIQDNANFEMACQIEGPIVDSLYDMALISWYKKLDPPLPAINSPAVAGGIDTSGHSMNDRLFGPNGELIGSNVIVHPGKLPKKQSYGRADTEASVLTGPTTVEAATHPVQGGAQGSLTPKQEPVSTVKDPRLVSDPVGNENRGGDFSTETYLASGTSALPQAQIEHPSANNALPEHTPDDPHYDNDIAGEVARVQSAVSPKDGETRVQAVARHLNHTVNVGFKPTAPDCPPAEEMTPYIPHPTHEPFPIAMVNRYPYGPFTHDASYVPQNEAWLSALRNARKNVFIQSPNLNADVLLPAILDACRRGVDVYCYLCLGYNDIGELLPRQGGTNEMVSHKLYAKLERKHHHRLHIYFYVAKDQVAPVQGKRDCHIKLMIVDEHIGIQGSGNQDTQSWYHSQEVNIMFDSKEVSATWIDGLRRNQNTHLYGMVSPEDGVWRDKDGNEAPGAIGINPGRFSWLKGITGAVQRVQGTGGF